MSDAWEYTDDKGKWRVENNDGVVKTYSWAGQDLWDEIPEGSHGSFLADLVEQLNAQNSEIKQLKKDDHDLKERCFGVGGFLAMQNAYVGEVSRLTGTIADLKDLSRKLNADVDRWQQLYDRVVIDAKKP